MRSITARLAVMAVKIGKTRLIDNMVFEREETGTQ